MKIAVRNYKILERADVDVSRVVLVAGPNEVGKSCFCEAAAAALTGQPIPFLKPGASPGSYATRLPKASAGMLVRDGAAKAGVNVTEGESTIRVRWPQAEVSSEGTPPTASVYATGLIDPLELSDKARSALLSDVMGALPTIDDLKLAMADAGIGKVDKMAKKLWAKIEQDGWDVTHKAFQEQGAKLKGQWEAATGGDKYGKTKAAGWLPKGWDDDLKAASEEGLKMDLAAAGDARDQSVAGAAVGEDEIKRLAEAAEREPPDLETLEASLEAAEAAETKCKEVMAKTSQPLIKGGLRVTCPFCEEESALIVKKTDAATTHYDLEKPGKQPTKAEIKKRADAYQEAENAVNQATGAARKADAAFDEAKGAVQRIERANEALEKAQAKEGGGKAVEEAREAVRRAQDRLDTFSAWTKATHAHASVAKSQRYLDILAPAGVRKTRLLHALKAFNAKLADLSAAARWPTVSVNGDLELEYGGEPYFLISWSAKYRVRATLRCALALEDGSDLVIFDEAGVLDDAGRPGLVKMILHTHLKAIIGMTFSKPEQLPSWLEKARVQVYWIADGICEPIVEMERQAA